MKTALTLILMLVCAIARGAVVTKGTQAETIPQAERHWLKQTEAQRVANHLWSRREWASVKPEIRGYGAGTAQMRVAKTFGGSMTPKASTTADLHCYRIVWGPAAKWSLRGLPVKFDLKYCTDGKLRQDITDPKPAGILPMPKAYTLPVMPKMLMAKAIAYGAKAVSYPATIVYPPSAVVVKMYFTNDAVMGRRVYAYADHPSGERWSMQTSSGFYGSSLLWFTPPSYEDTPTQVRVTVPVNPSGFFFRAVKHR